MPVGRLLLELSIEGAQSIKDRRQVVRSLKDKLRHGFNVSVAELDDATLWNRATLGVAAISSSTDYVNGLLQQAEEAVNRLAPGLGATVLDSTVDLLEEDQNPF